MTTAAKAATPAPSATPPATDVRTRHFIANLHGSTAPAALGYDVFDTSPSGLAALPVGVQGMVWLGQKCPTPIDAAFRATVDALAQNSRVYGYYLADEPHVADCPGGPAALSSRTDYIKKATAGRQQTLAVLSRAADVSAFRPAVTGITLVGLDPYPCSVAHPGCDDTKVAERVGWATSAGIPLSSVVPAFQAFGQEAATVGHYYNLPTAAQERSLLAAWAKYLPHPVMDYSYGWGHQGTSNPTLVDSPELQQVFKAYFATGSLS